MAQGQIHRLINRGFGFIRPDDGQADRFFHASQLVGLSFDELQEGDSVRYTPADDPRGKGPMAVQVERVKRAPGFTDEAGLPADPAPRPWPTAAGRAADEEVTDYDWEQAG